MAEADPLGQLEGLQQDLVAIATNNLRALERVLGLLEDRVEEFRALLDHRKKSDASRRKLQGGTLRVHGVEYSVNEEFRQESIKVADVLNLDEIKAAKLLISSEDDAQELDRPAFNTSIIRFHKRRHLLVECLRLTVKQATDPEAEDHVRLPFRQILQEILNVRDGQIQNGPLYWRKCLAHMADIERLLQDLAERLQSASVVGQYIDPEMQELVDHQLSSLTSQHESLAAICASLAKDGFVDPSCLQTLVTTLRKLEKHDISLIHYIPVLTTLISQFGSSDSSCTLREARSLHEVIVSAKESDAWASRSLHAAAIVWWLVEYSGRYLDNPVGSPLQGVDLEKEAEARSILFLDALKDGAFQFILSLSQDVRQSEWYDPAKAGLISFLLQETPVPPLDASSPAEYFQTLFMEQQQGFADAFITNMPDTLRRLKAEEDEHRKQIQSRFQRGQPESELHLERFLLIICLAFEGSSDAAQAFWSDSDGNLFGFLQWSAKRQTTPRVAAFCEMLLSISEGEECAEAAHRFLLEESSVASGKMRRTSSLSWSQIFNELEFYAKGTKDRIVPGQGALHHTGHAVADQFVEPESAMMLECYLRLAAHLCRQSSMAREWVLANPVFHLHDILFQLCGSGIDSRLRGCAFTAINSLLTDKTPAVADTIWTSMDKWIFGGVATSSNLTKSSAPTAVGSRSDQEIFNLIETSFEEPNAFVGVLNSLISPYPDSNGLNDSLPFPETLGSSYRMTGIALYLDSAIGRVFGNRSVELDDPLQVRILRLNCLTLIATCLSTFNENLVVFANRSNISVDSAIGSSSLAAYVRLHPFARAMEWVFNDKVIDALFAAARQDVEAVQKAASDSPLVLSIVKSLEVMDLIMKLQSTYLDIVRPLVKSEPTTGHPVANFALASFEDAVLNNLELIIDLGLYCGAGHKDLTIVSLRLLEKLSSSRKLSVSPSGGFGHRSDRSKIIGIMERNGDSERIARTLVAQMLPDDRELEGGPEAAGYAIKSSILSFLNSCLSAVSNRPTVAHILLGFTSAGSTIDIPDDGLFASGNSLFHAVLRLALAYPEMEGVSYMHWRLEIKQACIQILRKLWRSPLSAVLTMAELRFSEFLFVLATELNVVDASSLWDGRTIVDPEFLISLSAASFEKYLQGRTSYCDYVARELRMTVQNPMATLKSRILGTLLGTTVLPTGQQVDNLNVFDLFDFIELEAPSSIPVVDLKFFSDLPFEICREGGPKTDSTFDIRSVEELLTLRGNEMRQAGQLSVPADEQQFLDEGHAVILCLQARNQRQQIVKAQEEALRTWVQLMTVTLSSCDFEPGVKTSFILQSLQVIQPKLEQFYNDNQPAAMELTELALTLIKAVDFAAKEFRTEDGKTGDFATNRLAQLFRVGLAGSCSDRAPSRLRETCYQICFRYLRGIARTTTNGTPRPSTSPLGRETIRIVKVAGDALMDTVCDDAYTGEGTCRISALLLLEALVALGIRASSSYIVEAFSRLNFVPVLAETIKNIPNELRATQQKDVPLLLSYYETTLSLLLRIAQTRKGAALVLNAGLFQAVKESQIFSADPDIGFEVDNPAALKRFFDLMLSVLRVINCVVLSRGPQNDQTLYLAREFLKDNRASIVGVFKRNAKVGGMRVGDDTDLSDLVDNFTLLLSATEFLETEDKSSQNTKATVDVFS